MPNRATGRRQLAQRTNPNKPDGPRRSTTVVAWAALAFAILFALLLRLVFDGADQPGTSAPPSQGCHVTVEGFSTFLSFEQAQNASIIVGESIRRELAPRAASIALTTTYQESGMRNLDYGDRDSVGLFQQRPSQGWGTVEQIMDPWYSSGKFYDVLVTIPDWQTGDINDVAQAVQRSGYPHAYRQHEQKGRSWASALTGYSPAAVSCVDRSDPPADAQSLQDYLWRVFGERITIGSPAPNQLVIQSPDQTTAWAVAQLALLRARSNGISKVAVGDVQMTVGSNDIPSWEPINQQPTPRPLPATGIVEVTLRG